MSGGDAREAVAASFRATWPRLVATAMRILGDLQEAEDVAQETLVIALDRWPLTGVPDNPAAWLTTACRNRALNRLRDAGRARGRVLALVPLMSAGAVAEDDGQHPTIADDRLRLVFICCHPALPVDAQIALTLRLVAGLATPEIAHAFHLAEPTVAQRIVRAKRTLAERQIPFAEPTEEELAARLPPVLDVVYLIFNEGYLASAGGELTRRPLAEEAYRLARLLTELLPAQAETWGLRALIAFQLSRDAARADAAGNLVTLEEQDRTLWDRALIADGVAALAVAGGADRPGPLTVQARIAACHATAQAFADTDWAAIVALYDQLLDLQGGAVVALNRAVAVAMAEGPAAGILALDGLTEQPALARGHRLWSIRADLLYRLGEYDQAVADYDRALRLVDNQVERRYLAERRRACGAAAGS